MKRGQDISARFGGLFLVHHNKPELNLDFHAHREHHLFLPLRGEIRVRTKDAEFSCGPGRMIYLPSDASHSFNAPNAKEGERLIALVEPALWKKHVKGKHAARLLPTLQLAKEIAFYLLLRPKTAAAPALARTFLETLGEALAGSLGNPQAESPSQIVSKARDPRLRHACEELEKNFADEIKISQLARRSGLSERSLNRLCVTELGCGPKDLLTRFRVEEARVMLGDGKSVTETAYAVGYQSLSRFIEAFRGVTGQLPSDFRAS